MSEYIGARAHCRLCLAGRSKEKLESVREEMRAIDGQYGVTELLAASVESPPQVAAMVEMTRVVINCVGPFGVYGEIVVRECASQGTHYVDITGECSVHRNVWAGVRDGFWHTLSSYVCAFILGPCICGCVVISTIFCFDGV